MAVKEPLVFNSHRLHNKVRGVQYRLLEVFVFYFFKKMFCILGYLDSASPPSVPQFAWLEWDATVHMGEDYLGMFCLYSQ